MKQWIKRLGLLLIFGSLVFSLCGCKDLDRLREYQIFIEEDGSFYHEGKHYVQLDANDYFSPVGNYTRNYFLTEPDVPVLLSSEFAVSMLRFSQDGRFCRDIYHNNKWFCTEDIFEEIQAKNRESFVPDTIFYTYYVYTGEGNYESKLYILTPEEVAAIDAVCQTQPLQLTDGMYISYDWGMGLTAATEDLLFQYGGPSIFQANNTYYMEIYGDYGSTTYQVPEEYNATFAHILDAYAKTRYY